jgi:prephenate dehydrogenase
MPLVGVIGTGLIGGSIAAGLTADGWDVVGYDSDRDSLEIALERELIGIAVDSIAGILDAPPEIIIVAAPPKATIEILANLETSVVVMDVAAVKSAVHVAAAHLPRFVGTHPMAGREFSGPTAASPALFRGATWVVVEGSPDDATDAVIGVIETLGANPLFMSATSHDEVVASISHLPQLVAASLLASVSELPDAFDLAAGSFRDLTRVGASQPIPWVEILKSNKAAVLGAVDRLRVQLDTLGEAILADDDELLVYLSRSREARRALGAPVAAVRVALADEPGEIAKVGHALDVCHVDIRDIQMRHAPYGGGGVLTLSVRTGEEEALRHALQDAGLMLVQ